MKLKCAHSPLNLRILSSTSVQFTPTTVQVPNLALIHMNGLQCMYRSMNTITLYLIVAAVSKMKPKMRKFGETEISVSKLSFTQYKLQSPVVCYLHQRPKVKGFFYFFNCRLVANLNWRGRVEPDRRLEGRQFTKPGRKYQHDWLFLQSINSCHKVPLQVNFFRWRHFALVST